jgi:AraC-like DNA-binding protein
VVKTDMFNLDISEVPRIKYISSGKFVSDDEWIHPRRIIDSYEIIYVVEGCVYIQEEDKVYTLKTGEILILQPYKTHFGYNKSSLSTSFYWVHFLDVDNYIHENITQYTHFQDIYQINLLFKQLIHVVNTPQYPKYTAVLILNLIFTEILVRQKSQIKNYSPLLSDICEWIRINSEKSIRVKDVAFKFGYNEDYITRIFKKNFSVGIKEYINESKLKLIKNCLISTEYPIKEIAAKNGFEDYKNFLKYFKYHEGISPEKFRKMYFNTHLNKK